MAAKDINRTMLVDDPFHDLAPFYDRIMEHVRYDRWYGVTTTLAALLPPQFVHLDAACGTGKLIKQLRAGGWRSLGVDLSPAMVKVGRKGAGHLPVAVADLRALPFRGQIDYVTCLFDSINFLLDLSDVTRAFGEVATALREEGLFYFDIVTERMVTEHFDGQEWTEQNGRFSTTWRSNYSRKTLIADTYVRVNTGAEITVRERIYAQAEIESALREAGLSLLGAFDAHTWHAPSRRTVRIDFVAAKNPPRGLRRRFDLLRDDVREQLA